MHTRFCSRPPAMPKKCFDSISAFVSMPSIGIRVECWEGHQGQAHMQAHCRLVAGLPCHFVGSMMQQQHGFAGSLVSCSRCFLLGSLLGLKRLLPFFFLFEPPALLLVLDACSNTRVPSLGACSGSLLCLRCDLSGHLIS